MVRIRLRRTGLKHQTTYRIIAADKESPRDGRFLEILGSYNPRTNPSTVEIKEERVYDWMNKGAQPSDSVVQIFNSVGLLDRYTRLKAGESQEALLEEAKAAYEKHAAGSKTGTAPAEVKKPSAKKAAKEKAAAIVETAPKTAPKAVEPAPEVAAEAAPEAVVEEVAEVPAETPVEAVVDAPAKTPVEAVAEVPAETATDAAVETPAEPKAE